MALIPGQLHRRLWPVLAVLYLAAGCESASPEPTEGATVAIPDVPYRQEAACGTWSCSWQDCTQDPGVYGACCTRAAEQNETIMARPSCGGQPYCVQFPSLCGVNEYHPAQYCQGRAGNAGLWDCDNYCSVGTGTPANEFCCWQPLNENYPNCDLNL